MDGKLTHDMTPISEIDQENVSKAKKKHDTDHVSNVH